MQRNWITKLDASRLCKEIGCHSIQYKSVLSRVPCERPSILSHKSKHCASEPSHATSWGKDAAGGRAGGGGNFLRSALHEAAIKGMPSGRMTYTAAAAELSGMARVDSGGLTRSSVMW
jgi:hypothetical protein